MIELRIEGAAAVATLVRPPVNAVNEAWIERLAEIVEQVEGNAAIGVLWIRSALDAFCAGADLELMRACFESAAGRERMIGLVRRMQQVFARLERLGAVSIAELGGAALGGGLELALACDLRVVADSAKLGLPEAGLGLLPGAGGTQRLTRACGDALARRLILGAEIVDGTNAVALGIAHWVAPRAGLEAFTRALVERIARLPPATLAACKRCIGAALDPQADGYALELAETRRLYGATETQRRVKRFLDKQG
ncbi:MAG: enoyl-CoA hydratase/isomerase family protein [Betaproteobacteria bacterium]|nr:enoyl-CoA hydratase/isomerase family protein [Betaproteobacteria bacterium]